ncbi:MAG TPA: thiamine pyrophosphate-binding protein [Rhodospirillaceae bacterium]|nr:thiamine pyrophosphate-binding protein [Rhodospirillaceae bacterium]
MADMTGGQAIVRTLTNHGIDTIFGLPGVQLDNTFDALYEAKNQLRTIHTRHEQGAAYMALGYAQASGKVGACIVGPGPGLLNAGAALCTAYGSNVPVICIAGQIPSNQIGVGIGATHEIVDQTSAMRGVVKWVGRADTPGEAPGVLKEAFTQMLGDRTQPVVFEMAPDMMGKVEDVNLLDPEAYDTVPEPDEDLLEKAAKLLGEAEKPMIFVGSGVFGSEAELQNLAETLEAPVVMSRTGRGALTDRHHLAQTMITGQSLWEDADVALVIGTRFSSPGLAWGRETEVKLIRIDVDARQAKLPREADITVISSAKKALPALTDKIGPHNRKRDSRKSELDAAKADTTAKLEGLDPQYGFGRVLRDALPEDGVLVTDVTQMATYMQNWCPVYQPRTLITPGYQATLGYGYPTALGAKVALPDKKVLCIAGDGGFMFNVQELSSAVAHGIDVVCVVFADKAYGNVKRFQKEGYGGRHIGVDLHNPDFAKMAETYGMTGIHADGPEALAAALKETMDAPGRALIEVPIGEVPNTWSLIKRPSSAGDKK